MDQVIDFSGREAARAARRDLRERGKARVYETGNYWRDRMDLMYYRYVDFIVRTLGAEAQSLIDIGTAQSPYLEWFDWIPERFSFDQLPPYESETVTGIQGDFFTHDFGRRFEIVTCLQVLEHVPDAKGFTQRLFEIADTVIISVPFEWGAGTIEDHVHDPVTRHKLRVWTGRPANYSIVVKEPFRAPRRLIAVYDTQNPKIGWGRKVLNARRRRRADMGPTDAP